MSNNNLSVQILVTVPKPEHFDACTLCFDTLRIGFPTADIYVTVNASKCLDDPMIARIEDKVRAAGCSFGLAPHDRPIHLAKWIEGEVERATGPLVLLDADTIFWKSCEDWKFPEAILLAGYYIPRMWNDFAKCVSMPRLHTSFLFMPDPPALRQRIKDCYPPASQEHGEYCPCDPFMPAVKFIGGRPYFWDSCANLYGMLMPNCGTAQARAFQPEHLACYDHLNSASFFEVMLDRLDGDKEAFAYLHYFMVKQPVQFNLRNLWPMVDRYYQAKAAQAAGKSLVL
jgi:hypothetical protein